MSDFLQSMERRRFLALSGISAVMMAGCASIDYARNPGFNYYRDSRRLIIDAHCHLMNEHDSSPDFVDRHVFEANGFDPVLRFFGDGLVRIAAQIGYGSTMTAKEELAWLKCNQKKLQKNPKQFYEIADKNQERVFPANEYHQMTGMFSNRTRNAARMLIQFPQVDIFTPAMVDFYEGNCASYSTPEELADYYSELNVASLGRFLPLISFNPERALDHNSKDQGLTGCTLRTPLETVKMAIEEMGFIGVKLHPSAGFSPINNEKNGCANASWGKFNGPLSEDPERAKAYNESLAALFAYCRGADVPILTHSGASIPANKPCMEPKEKDPLDWTGAPPQWFEAMDKANDPEITKGKGGSKVDPALKLRVCLAHFSGGLMDKKEGNSPAVTPSAWLKRTLEEMPTRPDLYIDLSAMDEWFDDKNNINAYRNIIKELIVANPPLKKQLMYGSDWHMPKISAIGSPYLTEIDEMIAEIQSNDLSNPNEYSSNIMGQNAVDFYGLAPGRKTRQRLVKFYDKYKITDKISWMKKIT